MGFISLHRINLPAERIAIGQGRIFFKIYPKQFFVSQPRLPKSIPFIVANEAAERFSYYGMRSILTTFLVTQFYNPLNQPALAASAGAKANELTHFFIALSYFLPVLGALAADWFFGKYKVILWLSFVYCIGNFFTAAFNHDLDLFILGIVLIAVGAGGIKPCVSANVGDQFTDENRSLLSKGFSLFYFSINSGSFIATLLIPVVMQHYGPVVAFGLPGILMLIATLVFILGSKYYIKLPPSGFKKENFIAISFYALLKKKKGVPLWQGALSKYSEKSVEGVKAVWNILAVFIFVPVFWALYDQNTSEWVLQATRMDLHVFGIEILAQQVQSVNAILILVFIPLFTSVIYPFLKRKGVKLFAYRKMTAGFILTILAFLIIYSIQLKIDHGAKPGIIWQVWAYVLLTAGEICLYLTGLEYAYIQAPPSMKSTIMSLWLLTVSVGNLIVSFINNSIAGGGVFSGLTGARYYLFFIIVGAITTVLFFMVARRFKESLPA
jgi:POT family proton-dependent oligopeptide transporter